MSPWFADVGASADSMPSGATRNLGPGGRAKSAPRIGWLDSDQRLWSGQSPRGMMTRMARGPWRVEVRPRSAVTCSWRHVNRGVSRLRSPIQQQSLSANRARPAGGGGTGQSGAPRSHTPRRGSGGYWYIAPRNDGEGRENRRFKWCHRPRIPSFDQSFCMKRLE